MSNEKQCPSSGPIKEMGYLVGLTERAIIYDLFLPDSSFVNKETDAGILDSEPADPVNHISPDTEEEV